jgi:AcrR family transcriptional regulator
LCLIAWYVYTVNVDTRQTIIECALRELETEGLGGFSLRAVGSAAGLSAMAVYRHFKNKEDLLRAVGEEAFAAYQLRFAALPDAPIQEWLRRAGREYVEFALDDPGRFEACFVLRTQVERIYPQDFRAGKSPVISLMAQKILAAQAAGQLEPADALEIAMLLWAQLHGLVMLHRSGRFSLSRRAFLALCDRAGALIVSGLFRTPAQPARANQKTGNRRLR